MGNPPPHIHEVQTLLGNLFSFYLDGKGVFLEFLHRLEPNPERLSGHFVDYLGGYGIRGDICVCIWSSGDNSIARPTRTGPKIELLTLLEQNDSVFILQGISMLFSVKHMLFIPMYLILVGDKRNTNKPPAPPRCLKRHEGLQELPQAKSSQETTQTTLRFHLTYKPPMTDATSETQPLRYHIITALKKKKGKALITPP